jgi:hypothetical protein
MSQDAIKKVIDKIPNLTNFGIGLFEGGKRFTEIEKELELKKGQEELLKRTVEFEKICHWLSKKEQRNSINTRISSYGLKHIAEKEIGYVTNGSFIAAAVSYGFAYRISANSPNALFNISDKSLRN